MKSRGIRQLEKADTRSMIMRTYTSNLEIELSINENGGFVFSSLNFNDLFLFLYNKNIDKRSCGKGQGTHQNHNKQRARKIFRVPNQLKIGLK